MTSTVFEGSTQKKNQGRTSKSKLKVILGSRYKLLLGQSSNFDQNLSLAPTLGNFLFFFLGGGGATRCFMCILGDFCLFTHF